jgi:hypothetical protein
MALAGLEDIHRLTVRDADEDAAARVLRWQRIAAIADACHRIPFPTGNPLGIDAVQFPPRLRDGWTRTGEEGRVWCRERSASLPYAAPRPIRRVLGEQLSAG